VNGVEGFTEDPGWEKNRDIERIACPLESINGFARFEEDGGFRGA
jgi:hypothetical protein